MNSEEYTSFSFRIERSALHSVHFVSYFIEFNLIFPSIDNLNIRKREIPEKYFAAPSLRIHIRKAGCIQLFQIIISKGIFLWMSFPLISGHYRQHSQTSVLKRQQLYLQLVSYSYKYKRFCHFYTALVYSTSYILTPKKSQRHFIWRKGASPERLQ